MKHRFFFIEGQIKYSTFYQYYQIEPDAIFHDDVMRYIRDSYQWVQSIQVSYPHKRETYGLHEYGINIVDQKGAPTFYGIIRAWKDLFSQAPEEFQLTCGPKLDRDYKFIEFNKLTVKRDFLVDNLSKLSECALKTVQGEGYILHLGI